MTVLALIAVVSIFVWVLGGVVLRIAGGLLLGGGLLALSVSGRPAWIPTVLTGVALWILGRLHSRLRHG
jgi:hypothetical protein